MNKPKTPERILIIKHGAFGDLMQAEGVLHDIRQHYPRAHLALLTTPGFVGLMQRCPHIDQVLVDHRAPLWQLPVLWDLYRRLHAARWDTVIDLQNSTRTSLYRHTLLRRAQWIGRLRGPAPVTGLRGQQHLLQEAGIDASHALQPNLSWMAANVDALLAQHGITRPYVVLVPGSSARHPEKRWPYYPQLAAALQQEGRACISVLGPDENELAADFACPVLQGLDWFTLAGVLQQAAAVVGNDSGPSHVASCLGRPGLALFGASTSPLRSELSRGAFETLQVESLEQLAVSQVMDKLRPKLPV
ncbi:MAG TPA: glycosyltransferase family 9 protein [Methylovorus sp.]|nr:glycosyltransferase family 9 protein [Methylovorus sp.]